MINFKNNLPKSLILLASAVIVLLLAIYLGNNFYINEDGNKYVSEIESELHKVELISDQIAKNITDKFVKNQNDFPFTETETQNLFTKKGISVLIYKNDTLFSWSDHHVPAPYLWNDSLSSGKLLNLKNGFYECRTTIYDKFKITSLILIKKNYRYRNDYLSNTFNPLLNIPDALDITLTKGKYNVNSEKGEFLFSLKMPEKVVMTTCQYMLVFSMYVVLFVLLSAALYFLILFFSTYKNYLKDLVILNVLTIAGLRYIIFRLALPEYILDTPLFGPQIFAYSSWLPSFGELIINVLTVTLIIIVLYKRVYVSNPDRLKAFTGSVICYLLFFALIGLYGFIMESLIINSNIPFNLNDIFKFNIFSVTAYFLILLIVISVVLAGFKLGEFNFKYINKFSDRILTLFISFIICLLLDYFVGTEIKIWYFIIALIIAVLFVLSFEITRGKYFLGRSFFFIALLSAFATYILFTDFDIKEKENRKLTAMKLLKENDPVAEFLFNNIPENLHKDTSVIRMVNQYPVGENILRDHILQKYFCDYWDKFNLQLTFCTTSDRLSIQPNNLSINCNAFFNDIIQKTGTPTLSENLNFITYNTGDQGYLGKIPFVRKNNDIINDTLTLFVEFTPKFVLKGLGLPELLIDKKINFNPDVSDYSYARYKNKELEENYGKFIYPAGISTFISGYNDFVFVNYQGFNHLILKADNKKEIVISKKNSGIFEILAQFSYLFVFLTIIGAPVVFVLDPNCCRNSFKINLQGRLQISMVVIIIVSFCVIGFSSVYYIISLNNNKNNNALSEKAHSILIELQHNLSDREQLTPQMSEELELLLRKFNNVFFTDINLFDVDGQLLATTRPELYDEGLVSARMDAYAFNIMKKGGKTRLITNESIGDMEFLSAYIPFRNTNNQIIAYINLPYFARQSELEREIATFITAFVNIFIFITGLSVLLALVISKYITRPLQLIRTKIRTLKLGHKNEKIEWKRDDEIGSLISEYNRLTDELEYSASLLARSERESAWREMAKQVAHEIKNPLTPMKLSVQYLQKAWKEDAPDRDKRIDNFTRTIIEQIDTLSEIASEFSDFAQMPKAKPEIINLKNVIADAINLYKGLNNINFDFAFSEDIKYMVAADKKQLLRAFNNLINNAVQAIGEKNGKISVSLSIENTSNIIYVKDNGGGIAPQQQDKIFVPSFSTKTGGMGLGLAIVKNIIESIGGEIKFESVEGIGTTFIVKLPFADTGKNE